MAVLQELRNDGDVGGEVVVEAGFVGEGELGGLCGGSGLADQAEGDLVDGVGIIAGFGGPRYRKNCSVVRRPFFFPLQLLSCPLHENTHQSSVVAKYRCFVDVEISLRARDARCSDLATVS